MWDLTIHPFLVPIDVRTHNPPLSRTSVLDGTRSFLQSMWNLTIHLFRGLAFSLALVPLFNWCGISQYTTFRAQHPRWHTARCPPFFKAQRSRWHTSRCPHFFRAQHPRWHSFLSSTNVESNNPPPWGRASSLTLVPLFNRCGISQSTLFEASVRWHTVQCPPFFEAHHPHWHTAWCLAQIPLSSSPPLADILLFKLFLLGFPSKFLKRVCY